MMFNWRLVLRSK